MPRKIVKKLVTGPVKGAASRALAQKRARRVITDEFRREAVAMLLDGHSASSVAKRLGLASSNVLCRWKAAQLRESGPMTGLHQLWVGNITYVPLVGGVFCYLARLRSWAFHCFAHVALAGGLGTRTKRSSKSVSM